MSELCDFSAVVLRQMIGGREISPVELLDSCLARIAQANPSLNAVVALDEEMARREARRAEDAVLRGAALGPLHGLPVGIKDLNETAGLRTTFGSKLYEDHLPERDDSIVASIRAAGGLIFAKTNTPEFGAGANTVNDVYGFTGNPFDPDRTCGGSSGGSAVALATSMLPLATGSDLGGSLRTPASFCGIVGMRPSPGLVPATDSVTAFQPLSVEGPMGRSVADLSLLLSAMARYDLRDPYSAPIEANSVAPGRPADLSTLRVALSEDLGFAPVSAAVRHLFRDRAEEFATVFAACEDADPSLDGAVQTFETLRAVGFLARHKDRFEAARDRLGPNVAANVELGLQFSAEDVARAAAAQTISYRRFLRFMERYDLLICPAAPISPFGKGRLYPEAIDGQTMETYIHWVAISFGITLTAHPAIVLPCGVDQAGLPFGIQVVGRRGQDRRLLSCALALERHLGALPGCRRPVPGQV